MVTVTLTDGSVMTPALVLNILNNVTENATAHLKSVETSALCLAHHKIFMSAMTNATKSPRAVMAHAPHHHIQTRVVTDV